MAGIELDAKAVRVLLAALMFVGLLLFAAGFTAALYFQEVGPQGASHNARIRLGQAIDRPTSVYDLPLLPVG